LTCSACPSAPKLRPQSPDSLPTSSASTRRRGPRPTSTFSASTRPQPDTARTTSPTTTTQARLTLGVFMSVEKLFELQNFIENYGCTQLAHLGNNYVWTKVVDLNDGRIFWGAFFLRIMVTIPNRSLIYMYFVKLASLPQQLL
jgi:hypothetical protein